jgi:hypothetical protein
MKKIVILATLLLCSVASLAQLARPAVYIEPQNGFEMYLAAAISKKNVPVDVVTDHTKATYLLKAAPIEIKTESTGGKIARCAINGGSSCQASQRIRRAQVIFRLEYSFSEADG